MIEGPTDYMAEWKFGSALRQNENKKIFHISSMRFENVSVFLPLKSQRSTHSKAVLVDSLMTIDTKSPDQSVAQQLTTTTAHERIAPSLIAEVKSSIAPSVVAVVKSPMT